MQHHRARLLVVVPSHQPAPIHMVRIARSNIRRSIATSRRTHPGGWGRSEGSRLCTSTKWARSTPTRTRMVAAYNNTLRRREYVTRTAAGGGYCSRWDRQATTRTRKRTTRPSTLHKSRRRMRYRRAGAYSRATCRSARLCERTACGISRISESDNRGASKQASGLYTHSTLVQVCQPLAVPVFHCRDYNRVMDGRDNAGLTRQSVRPRIFTSISKADIREF